MQRIQHICALSAALVAANAAAFEFKGLTPDQEPSPPLLGPAWTCQPSNQLPGKSFCVKPNETIAGFPARSTVVSLRNGKVEVISVVFDESGFNQVSSALIEKYGAPTTEKIDDLQNRMGATFQSRRLVWITSSQSMMLTQRGKRIDESNFTIISNAAVTRSSEDERTRAKSNSSDL